MECTICVLLYSENQNIKYLFTMKAHSLFLPFTYLFLSFLLCNCINADYDLSKDIDKDIVVGAGGIVIPLGTTEPITLDKFIEVTEDFVLEDGLYCFKKSSVLPEQIVGLESVCVKINTEDIDSVKLEFKNKSRFNGVKGKNLYADFFSKIDIEINQEVPKELVKLKKLNVQDGEPINVLLSIDFNEKMQSAVERVRIENTTVVLPSYLSFEEDEDFKDGMLIINEVVSTSQGYRKALRLKSADFTQIPQYKDGVDTKVVNGKTYIILEDLDPLVYQGKVTLETNELTNNVPMEGFELLSKVYVEPFDMGVVEGVLDLDIKPIEKVISFDLSEEKDFFNDDAVLDFHNPQMKLSFGNTLKVPIEADIILTSLDKDGNEIKGSRVDIPHIAVKPAISNGVYRESHILLSRRGTELDGYETVVVEDLNNLFATMPKKIKVEILADTYKSEGIVHEVDLSQSVMKGIKGQSDIYVPMAFDELRLRYIETIDSINWGDNIADNKEEVLLQLRTTVENTIPLEFKLRANVFNEDGDSLKDIIIDEGCIKSGSLENSSLTEAVLEMNVPKGLLKQIYTIEIVLDGEGKSSTGELELRNDEYVQLNNLIMSIKGGLDLEFKEAKYEK